jgi:hypothetical protein
VINQQQTDFSRGIDSQMRTIHFSNTELARLLSEKTASDINLTDIADYRHGFRLVPSAHKTLIAKFLDRSVDYLEHLGRFVEKFNTGDRSSVLLATGVLFSRASRGMSTIQLSIDIAERGGVSIATARGIVKKLENADYLDELSKTRAAKAFGVPAVNLELIGERVIIPPRD